VTPLCPCVASFKIIKETPPALGPGEANPFEEGVPGAHDTQPMGASTSSTNQWTDLVNNSGGRR
jgi:hypothetical protein